MYNITYEKLEKNKYYNFSLNNEKGYAGKYNGYNNKTNTLFFINIINLFVIQIKITNNLFFQYIK